MKTNRRGFCRRVLALLGLGCLAPVATNVKPAVADTPEAAPTNECECCGCPAEPSEVIVTISDVMHGQILCRYVVPAKPYYDWCERGGQIELTMAIQHVKEDSDG